MDTVLTTALNVNSSRIVFVSSLSLPFLSFSFPVLCPPGARGGYICRRTAPLPRARTPMWYGPGRRWGRPTSGSGSDLLRSRRRRSARCPACSLRGHPDPPRRRQRRHPGHAHPAHPHPNPPHFAVACAPLGGYRGTRRGPRCWLQRAACGRRLPGRPGSGATNPGASCCAMQLAQRFPRLFLLRR